MVYAQCMQTVNNGIVVQHARFHAVAISVRDWSSLKGEATECVHEPFPETL